MQIQTCSTLHNTWRYVLVHCAVLYHETAGNRRLHCKITWRKDVKLQNSVKSQSACQMAASHTIINGWSYWVLVDTFMSVWTLLYITLDAKQSYMRLHKQKTCSLWAPYSKLFTVLSVYIMIIKFAGCRQQWYAGSGTLHQQDPPVFNGRCWLTQVDLYNDHKTGGWVSWPFLSMQ